MRVIYILLLSLIFSLYIHSQETIDCKSQLTVVVQGNSLIFSAWSFLETEVDDLEDLLVSISPDTTLLSSIDLADIDAGVYNYLVVQESTGNTCWGNIEICKTDCIGFGPPPIPLCIETLSVVIEEKPFISSSDIDAGSQTATGSGVIAFALRRIEDAPNFIFPGSDGFESLDTLQLDDNDICNEVFVALQVWDINGLTNECLTKVCVSSVLALCAVELGCSNQSSIEVSENEIPLVVEPRIKNVEVLTGFTINDQKVTEYGNSLFGMPKNSLQDTGNNLKLEVKNLDYLNGVSTLDMVILLQSILGLNEPTAAQIIAGDVDQSGDISLTNDIYMIQQLILGIMPSFENDNYFLLTNAQEALLSTNIDPFNFEHEFGQYTFDTDELNESEGIKATLYKYGDLNQNFTELRSADIKFLQAELKSDGHSIELNIPKDKDGFLGLQFGLDLNKFSLHDVQHEYGNKLKYHLGDDNILKISMTSDQTQFDFSITINLNDKVEMKDLRKISIDDIFPTEYISPELYVSTIELNPISTTSPELTFDSIKIYPNPAYKKVNIQLNKAAVGKSIKVFNQLGQIEYKAIIKSTTINISDDDLHTPGLKYIQIEGEEIQKFIMY